MPFANAQKLCRKNGITATIGAILKHPASLITETLLRVNLCYHTKVMAQIMNLVQNEFYEHIIKHLLTKNK